MALWQYTFIVIPRESAGYEILPDEFGGYETAPHWFYADVDKEMLNDMEQILPKGESWSENLTVYGKLDSNCIEIYCEDNQIDSISFRIDFHSDYTIILKEFVTFCIEHNLALVDESLNVTDMDANTLTTIIENSPQKRLYKELSGEE